MTCPRYTADLGLKIPAPARAVLTWARQSFSEQQFLHVKNGPNIFPHSCEEQQQGATCSVAGTSPHPGARVVAQTS